MLPGNRPAEGSLAERETAFGSSRRPEEPAALDSRNGRLPPATRAAVFLDRDGVLNDQTGFVNKPDDFELLPGAAAAVRRLNETGIPVVVITNQGGIAMGYLTEAALHEIHSKMERDLAASGAHVDGIYYCPHMPNARIVSYLGECPCRKPGIGMLEQARDELGIDLRASYLVGDATTDILAGIRAGCTTILVKTGFGGNDGKAVAEPDHVAADLAEAVGLIRGRLDSADR